MPNRKKKTSPKDTKLNIVKDDKYYESVIKRDWCNLREEFVNLKGCKKCKDACANAGQYVLPSYFTPKGLKIGVPSRFNLSLEEQKSASKFIEEHIRLHSKCNVSYIFTNNTGIGTGLTIRCNVCGKEQDITDYKNW